MGLEKRLYLSPHLTSCLFLQNSCESTEHFLKTIANLPCGHGQAISPFPFWKMMEMILHRKGVKYETMDAKLLGCSPRRTQQVTAVPVFPEWHEVFQPLQTNFPSFLFYGFLIASHNFSQAFPLLVTCSFLLSLSLFHVSIIV